MVREKEQGPADLGPPWTVLKLLRWTADYFDREGISESPRLDADLLLADVLDIDRVALYARFDTEVDDSDRAAFRKRVKRRAAGEPVAYLVERKEFWQHEFAVDERVMIPRPETEVLVEVVLEHLPDEPVTLVDAGTGSGAIAITLAEERPQDRVVGTDLSPDALDVAVDNGKRLLGEDAIEWFQGDLLDALPDDMEPPDVVVSNPPYVPESDREGLAIDVRDHEPERALFAGPDGMAIYDRLVPQASGVLAPGGWLFVEIGADQGEAVGDRFRDAGFDAVEVRRDYADRDRVVLGRAPEA